MDRTTDAKRPTETDLSDFLDELFDDLFDRGDIDDSIPDLGRPLEKLTQRSAQDLLQGL
jgi:hypothetical protein